MSTNRFLLLLLTTAAAAAGPLEFGRAELNAALAARKIEPALLRVVTEMSADPGESYRIDGPRIFGGDLRGLMYGLLEAAEQIRATGKLSPAKAVPACALRGVRILYQNQPKEFWTSYIQMLARNRFNRLNVVFPKAPSVERIGELSQTANDHGMDFVLTLQGETKDLTALLTRCKGIRAIHLQSNPEQAFEPIRRAGHLVTLELDSAQTKPTLLEAAKQAGIRSASRPATLNQPLNPSYSGATPAMSAAPCPSSTSTARRDLNSMPRPIPNASGFFTCSGAALVTTSKRQTKCGSPNSSAASDQPPRMPWKPTATQQ